MLNTNTVLVLVTVSFATTQSFCSKGCKCKAYDYCYDCETGYYRQDGECKSCSTKCLSCSSNNTCGKCGNGYYVYKSDDFSISCWPCSTGCTQCTSETNCLQCNAGYFRNNNGCTKCLSECETCSSQSKCNTCIDRYILKGSSCQRCPVSYYPTSSFCLPCQNNCASCSIINECTKCKRGFFGKVCNQKCSFGCEDNICEQKTGKCTCKGNFAGPNCNMCKPKKYGLDCDLYCPRGCLTCDSSESCNVGNTGYLEIECNYSECNRWTGQCRQCRPFFNWPCLECVDGKWGKNCTFDCPVRCLQCLSETYCKKCKDGYYHSDGQCLMCPTICFNVSCYKHSGSCNDGCRAGHWGKFCNESCPKNCFNGTCHNENGTCRLGCKDGYHGNKCDCPKHCICSHGLGNCNQCGNNTFYGQFCDKKCSNTCIDRKCDTLTGRCTSGCTEGYFGDNCSKLCRSNCRKLPCNRETGLCNSEETDGTHILLKVADINVILLACITVLVIYAIVTTFVLIKKRNLRRRQLEVNETSGENAENNYQPAVYRNAVESDHMYAVPDATSSGNLPLVNIETRDSNNSAEDRNMYIHPVYAETTVRHEYEEIN